MLGGNIKYDTTTNRESPSPADGKANIIIELSTQISDQEYRISQLESELEEKDLIIKQLKSVKLSPREARSYIAIEAERTTQEMQSLAKEIKLLKRKKKKAGVDYSAEVLNNQDFSREFSSLSRDSGAVDLSSPTRNMKHDTESYPLLSQSHSNTSFTKTSATVS